ncbi:MAG: hypothetical protein ACHQUC_05050 [Chlamydiales bacterium]
MDDDIKINDNYFEKLHAKGILNVEMSIQEIQDLLKEGKITIIQFIQILIQNLGVQNTVKMLTSLVEEHYSKDLLKDEK